MASLTKTKKIAFLGLLTCIALIFSYVESVIPFNFGIPGIKLGLSNAITVLTLYYMGEKESFAVTFSRIVLSSVLFSGAFSMIYSLSGGLLSLIIMIFLKRFSKLSIVGISMSGGIFHNIGQLIVAIIIVKQLKVSYYAPILIIAGLITGTIIGIICLMIKKKLKHMFDCDTILM